MKKLNVHVFLRLISVFFLFLFSFSLAQAQFFSTTFRPKTNYEVLKTAHFDVIYDKLNRAEAEEAAHILETTLADTQKIIGNTHPFRLTVILNGYNDESNGFVTLFPFRSEVEIPAIRGKILNMNTDSWFELVLPHELTHAVDMDAYSRKLFSKSPLLADFGRILNGIRPSGMLEGIATFRESQLEEGKAGRLNYPFFQNVYQAASAKKAWSFIQAMNGSSFLMNGGRHYNGGANFMKFLHEKYGEEAFAKFSKRFNKYPYMGVSIAFKKALKTNSRKLSKQFQAYSKEEEQARQAQLGELTKPNVVHGKQGISHQRPLWLNNQIMLSQMRSYNHVSGLYKTDVQNGKSTFFAPYLPTEDAFLSLDASQNRLFFSTYQTSKHNSNQSIADVFSLDLNTKQITQITKNQRVFTPVLHEKAIYATQNRSQFSDLVRIKEDGMTEMIWSLPRGRVLEIAARPNRAELALLVNHRGKQGIVFGNPNAPDSFRSLLAFDHATIYDASWHPNGEYLLFTADWGQVANVYAFHLATKRLHQLTNTAFGASEPSVSPDGKTVAYTHYDYETQAIATLPFDVSRFKAVSHHIIDLDLTPSNLDFTLENATTKSYRVLETLAPRVVLPLILPNKTLGNQYGVMLSGSDMTQRFIYELFPFYQASRLYAEGKIQSGRFSFNPALSFFNRPLASTNQTYFEERGLSLNGTLPLYLQTISTQSTVAQWHFNGGFKQRRSISKSSVPEGDFTPYASLGSAFQVSHRLAQPRRLMQPAQGVLFSVQAQMDRDVENGRTGLGGVGKITTYLPIGTSRLRSISLSAAMLTQNKNAKVSTNGFEARGFDTLAIEGNTLLKGSLHYTKSLWFMDSGFNNVPLFFDALYLFGFGDAVASPKDFATRQSSIGAGFGLRGRITSAFSYDLRFGGAYLVQSKKFAPYFDMN